MRKFEPIYRTPTRWALQIFFKIFYRTKIKGLDVIPRKGPVLIVSNHQSYFDPPVMAMCVTRPIRFAARRNLFKVPILGFILRIFYSIPLDRDRPDKDAFKRMTAELDMNEMVAIFPEGTRTPDGNIQELKPGFVRLALRSGAPLLPVVITGAYDSWHREWKYPQLKGKIVCKYYPPITLPENHGEMNRGDLRQLEKDICAQITKIFKTRIAAWQKFKSQK